MPQQLIYTSAPRGIVAGRSGYCTVARSSLMREPLMLQLEKFCYYQHLSLSGGQERPIFASRIVDIRGARFHVLSRLQDAGLDFTGRTNFIAHHLVFTPEELRQYPLPPVILRDWPGWRSAWTSDPHLLEEENWADLAALNTTVLVPSRTWEQVSGDAANGYGLLEARAGASFRVDDQNPPAVLQLFAESLALLEIREQRRDPRVAAWAHTFTTSMQEQDNPADFRWRCLHSDNPAAGRFATPDCRPLSAVRAIKFTAEEAAFARTGPQPPHFVMEPQARSLSEGEVARFSAKAEGVPHPAYQWFAVDRAERRHPLAGETAPELVISNPTLGISRYVVRASNAVGDVQSAVAELSVEARAKMAATVFNGPARAPANASHQKSPAEIEGQRQRIATLREQEDQRQRVRRKMMVRVLTAVVVVLALALVASACVFGWLKMGKNSLPAATAPKATNSVGASLPSSIPLTNEAEASAGDFFPPAPVTNAIRPILRAQASLPLPAPWIGRNIGWSSAATAPRYEPGTFILTAAPGAILPNQIHDSFYFANQSWSGGLEFVARFSKAGRIGKSRGGLMVRASDRDDAAFVFIGCSETSVLWMQRTAPGAPSTQESYSVPTQPLYLRLAHQDTNFSGEFSSDGANWLPLCAKARIDLDGPKYLVGFALCSSVDEKLVHADFDNVAINGARQ